MKSKPTVPRGYLARGVVEALAKEPWKTYTPQEVADMIGHPNLGSVQSALDAGHRDPRVPVMRVAPRTYQFGHPKASNEPESPVRPVNDKHLGLGVMFEVVGFHGGKVIMVDDQGTGFWLAEPTLLQQA